MGTVSPPGSLSLQKETTNLKLTKLFSIFFISFIFCPFTKYFFLVFAQVEVKENFLFFFSPVGAFPIKFNFIKFKGLSSSHNS